jgi:hypothetical protein
MTREELAARMEEFRAAYRVSMEAGGRLTEPVGRSGRSAERLQPPREVRAAARRVQAELLRGIEADCPRPRVPVRGAAAGTGEQLSPDNFVWRTMGR